MHRRNWLWLSCVVLGVVLVSAGVVVAASTAVLLGFQIDYLGVVDNGDGTSTWTYAVTADGDEPHGLSYWALEIGGCYEGIVAPPEGSYYTTSVDPAFGCGSIYNCQAATCVVEHSKDPGTGIYGIKFEDCTPELNGNMEPLPRTQIFQFTVIDVPATPADVAISAKAGTLTETGLITGPSCGPTGISLGRFEASSGQFLRIQHAFGALSIALGLVVARAASRFALR